MPEIAWSSIGAAISALISAIFNGIVATLKTSYETSHKWFAIGCIIFLALLWLGFARLPTFSATDAGVAKQITSLSAKMDAMAAEIDGLRISLDTLKDLESSKPTPDPKKKRRG
jgi:hypothetical protein